MLCIGCPGTCAYIDGDGLRQRFLADQRLGVIQRHLVPNRGHGNASGEELSVRQEQTGSRASGIWEHVPQVSDASNAVRLSW